VININIQYNNWITGETFYINLSLVDLVRSEGLLVEDATGEHVTDLLHVTKSLSALGDILSSFTSKKEMIPYENSRLTRLLENSIGGRSKTLLIVNVCPNTSNLPRHCQIVLFMQELRVLKSIRLRRIKIHNSEIKFPIFCNWIKTRKFRYKNAIQQFRFPLIYSFTSANASVENKSWCSLGNLKKLQDLKTQR
ncbi:hypothetical protein MKX03_019603, partial [Papaver bracteatum]